MCQWPKPGSCAGVSAGWLAAGLCWYLKTLSTEGRESAGTCNAGGAFVFVGHSAQHYLALMQKCTWCDVVFPYRWTNALLSPLCSAYSVALGNGKCCIYWHATCRCRKLDLPCSVLRDMFIKKGHLMGLPERWQRLSVLKEQRCYTASNALQSVFNYGTLLIT